MEMQRQILNVKEYIAHSETSGSIPPFPRRRESRHIGTEWSGQKKQGLPLDCPASKIKIYSEDLGRAMTEKIFGFYLSM